MNRARDVPADTVARAAYMPHRTITAGASAPEVLVDDVIEALRRIGPVKVSVLPGREENIEFRLPAELTAG